MPRTKASAIKGTTQEPPKIHCLKCGNSTLSNFYMSRDKHKQFFGKVPYCKDCIKKLYSYYLGIYDDENLAIYYTCRKIDIPYVHSNYLGAVEALKNPNNKVKGAGALMQAYMKGFGFAEQNGWGSTFDDSQGENQIEKLNTFDAVTEIKRNRINNPSTNHHVEDSDEYETIEYDTEFLQSKWGQTFENWELAYLEGEYLDWEEKLNGINDKTIDILVKQICYQLLDIYKDRQSGAAVDKKIKTLTDLMNNSGLIDKQDKANEKHQTLGMDISQIEYLKPATSGKKIFEDVDGIQNYIKGECGCYFKAMGIENEYTKFYDEWMKDYQVDIVNEMLATKQSEEKELAKIASGANND